MPDRIVIFGTWDLLHVGHVRAIRQAYGFCPLVSVGVETDGLTLLHKGHYPLVPEQERLEMVKALRWVDSAFLYGNDNYLSYVHMHKGTTVAWNKDNCLPRHQAFLQAAEDDGISIHLITYTPGVSTSDLRRKIKEAESC